MSGQGVDLAKCTPVPLLMSERHDDSTLPSMQMTVPGDDSMVTIEFINQPARPVTAYRTADGMIGLRLHAVQHPPAPATPPAP